MIKMFALILIMLICMITCCGCRKLPATESAFSFGITDSMPLSVNSQGLESSEIDISSENGENASSYYSSTVNSNTGSSVSSETEVSSNTGAASTTSSSSQSYASTEKLMPQ